MFIGNYKTVGIVNENKKIVKDALGKLYYLGYISKMVNVFSLLYGYTDNNNGSVAL